MAIAILPAPVTGTECSNENRPKEERRERTREEAGEVMYRIQLPLKHLSDALSSDRTDPAQRRSPEIGRITRVQAGLKPNCLEEAERPTHAETDMGSLDTEKQEMERKTTGSLHVPILLLLQDAHSPLLLLLLHHDEEEEAEEEEEEEEEERDGGVSSFGIRTSSVPEATKTSPPLCLSLPSRTNRTAGCPWRLVSDSVWEEGIKWLSAELMYPAHHGEDSAGGARPDLIHTLQPLFTLLPHIGLPPSGSLVAD
ncbi:unnamed protein product [Pleuronectes platessa]|uniref:Uncharacterized protein n=1 Tax=Pleuronectes platessa TaxID=8262 RepID=A0A9N7YGW6_PLEPL|nr:unnamed protein product [Pleuronectes platessa]